MGRAPFGIGKETIYALSTGSGRSAVGIVRVSGSSAGSVAIKMTGKSLPPPREAVLRRFVVPSTAELIDVGLLLWFPGPGSATGEDVAEFHVHGGRAIVSALLSSLSEMPNVRLAEPGEFTRRAFQAGRLDLTEAEAIADLVAAETDVQRRVALRQMGGALSFLYEGWRGRLLALMADLEATLDFSDQDLPDDLVVTIEPKLARLDQEMASHLNDGGMGERLREGLYIAILGAINAGKSSLLNRLAGRDAAIVSSRAGTTRDVIEVQMDLEGWPVTLADTAGLRISHDLLEMEGIRRALLRAENADLRVIVLDGAKWPALDQGSCDLLRENDMLVMNKSDLLHKPVPTKIAGHRVQLLSCQTGENVDILLKTLVDGIERIFPLGGDAVLTRTRHREALEACRASILRARENRADERMAEELRLASRHLGRITGRVDVEEVLGIVFSDFCIGK